MKQETITVQSESGKTYAIECRVDDEKAQFTGGAWGSHTIHRCGEKADKWQARVEAHRVGYIENTQRSTFA